MMFKNNRYVILEIPTPNQMETKINQYLSKFQQNYVACSTTLTLLDKYI